MNGLHFIDDRPVRPTLANRVDIACFVGLIGVRDVVVSGELPASLRDWLQRRGWLARPGSASATARDGAAGLLDVPIPIDDWEMFDRLFAWDARPLGAGVESGDTLPVTYLGAAVRSFFAEGGRRCYVVSLGNPLPWRATPNQRFTELQRISSPDNATASDRASWRGIAHLFGLPDVTFLSLPDLPELARAADIDLDSTPAPPLVREERFVECTPPAPPTAPDAPTAVIGAPVVDRQGLELWCDAVRSVALFLDEHRREVQLIASLPLPMAADSGHANAAHFNGGSHSLAGRLTEDRSSLASSFVQLVYPWLQTTASASLPGGIEPPEGRLIGMLARNALVRGTYRSATALVSNHLVDVFPRLSAATLYSKRSGLQNSRFSDRVSVFAPTPDGIRLVSDVTTNVDRNLRSASIRRTLAFITRAARLIGEETIFDVAGPPVWHRIKASLDNFLLALFHAGALDGAGPEDAFDVRCDRSTMSQQDIDNGRVIALVTVRPVASIELIEVAFTVEAGNSGFDAGLLGTGS